MSIESLLSISCDDDRASAVCDMIGLDGPGGYAIREPDGRVIVWQSEEESVDDDGSAAVYRSPEPVSAAVWRAVAGLAWIESSEEM